ncbi:helix-turn-helix domain-containing protein [Paenibacillus alba]|uniref:Helix-turn-helix domain-containing protein n=1 Tax=Paenibacillus alba TaxID=1197127 RepID=A0ABU6FWT2_9BACL|nr:helix-turn-helix domain-containing protein [Paenibacillus alba]MEC0226367.1 helix-turn-helix domain-containing protein [Paenibacillus alba]NQX70739.1 AraC family transcriptional regulator [Paenibacillus alba]
MMMKSTIYRRRVMTVFNRYLLSFTLLLFLPMLFLGFTGYYQLSTIVGDEVERNNQSLLNSFQFEVDYKLILMNKIANQITETPELSPYILTQDMFSAYQGKKILEGKVVDDSIREIVLHIRGSEKLYSSLSTYSVKDFVSHFYHFSEWTEAQFHDDLNHINTTMLRPAEDVRMEGLPLQRLITYIVPIPMRNQNPYGTVLFELKEDTLLKGLNPDQLLPNGNAMVFDQAGKVISAYKQLDSLISVDVYKQIASGENKRHIQEFQDQKFVVSFQKSTQSGLTYVIMLPYNSVVAPVHQAILKWMSYLLFILIIGCAFIYVVMVFNYNPIKKLASLVEAIRGQSIHKTNVFEAIGSVINDITDSNRTLGRKLEENRSAVRDHFLGSLLKGEFQTLDDVNERGKEVGIAFPFPDMTVMILEVPVSQVIYKEKLIAEVEQQFGGDAVGHVKIGLEERRAIFILSWGGTSEDRRLWLNRLHVHLSITYVVPITLGIGNSYREMSQVGRSYLEASTAIDYKMIKGNQRVIFFDDLMAHDHADLLNPRRILDELEIVLQYGEAYRITKGVYQIAMKIKQSGMTLFIAKELCYDMIHKFITFMENRSPGSSSDRLPDILALTDYTTLDEIADLLTTACTALCDSLNLPKSASPAVMIDQINQYIMQSYSEYDFSVQKIAEHFSLSLSYLSRYYKEQTGRTVMEYLKEVRIEQAKRLLRHTNNSVKEIVQQIGYYDVSSFIRTFKQQVGSTPGEYRKQDK